MEARRGPHGSALFEFTHGTRGATAVKLGGPRELLTVKEKRHSESASGTVV